MVSPALMLCDDHCSSELAIVICVPWKHGALQRKYLVHSSASVESIRLDAEGLAIRNLPPIVLIYTSAKFFLDLSIP